VSQRDDKPEVSESSAPSRPKLRPDPSVIVAPEVPTAATPTPGAEAPPLVEATLPITAPTPAWETDPGERIAGEPLPAPATSPPQPMPTQPTPAWNDAAPLPSGMVTETAPAWSDEAKPPASADTTGPLADPGPQANVVTEATPAWVDASVDRSLKDGTTRRKLPATPAEPDATRLKLPQVADEVPAGVTRPTRRPGGLSRPLKLGLAAFFTLSLVFIVWVFGRSDDVLDPSRPELIRTVKTTAVPLPPEKKVDVTPVIAAPKEPPKPAVPMELVVDAGDGAANVTHVSGSIVRIETEPPTNVFWNGNDFGWTPVLITMPVGPNTITLENKDQAFKRTLSVTAANEERTFLRFEFAKGWLSIDRPRTAKAVLVDGVKMMHSPLLLWEGRHRIEVVFANGQKGTKNADVVRGDTAELFFDDPLPQE